ncbi:hypothetical protein C8P68_104470 [Mucilaginibacter yixingensis]|uniref:CcmD family protein n=1 Tax=Mucilaginibacter yixingensis TaxID=1295612 RepID=A0A2T5JA84_9SPHI|nr:CcmD family protein [Mucilaginibacter yixingensis]PTQ96976.1 hypothetical protein C8P68_104470 [Mucilaginibacter yixingensis]
MKRYFITLLLLFVTSLLFAQNAQPTEMADAFRSQGKIYVVIATIAIIFVGLAIYLVMIDRRLRKIENDN